MKTPFSDLVGHTLTSITHEKEHALRFRGETLVFQSKTAKWTQNFHADENDLDIYIESIVGDFKDLLETPILVAEECTGSCEEGTYTFYKLATVRGWVDIRWVGESNGYYSETMETYKETK